MKAHFRFLLNPIEYFRAWRYARQQRRYDRSAFDLELWLYSRILANDMLHYGYFEDEAIDPATISIAMMEAAQVEYARRLTGTLTDKKQPVLDAGCGMGGLTGVLLAAGFTPHALTPNDHQIAYVRQKYPGIEHFHCKFEDLDTEFRYGAIICSESLQYIHLETAMQQVNRYLLPGGTWIVSDYFRLREGGHPSGHLLEDFRTAAAEAGLEITYERDITPNVLPTLGLINLYVKRFLVPLRHFSYEKLRFKRPFWYYMSGPARQHIDAKIDREVAVVNPGQFRHEKRYMHFALRKKRIS